VFILSRAVSLCSMAKTLSMNSVGVQLLLAAYMYHEAGAANFAAQRDGATSGLIRRATETQGLDISEAGAMHVEKKPHNHSRAYTADMLEKMEKEAVWTECKNCECKNSNMVIRYRAKQATADCSQTRNWYWVQHTTGGDDVVQQMTEDERVAFNRGFRIDPSELPSINLGVCGTTPTSSSSDLLSGIDVQCTREPDSCFFDNDPNKQYSNPFDAVGGQYCCDDQLKYCSYRCTDQETFACPSYDPNVPVAAGDQDGYPGGFDPCQGEAKACYIAEFPAGSTPEAAGDEGTASSS